MYHITWSYPYFTVHSAGYVANFPFIINMIKDHKHVKLAHGRTTGATNQKPERKHTHFRSGYFILWRSQNVI